MTAARDQQAAILGRHHRRAQIDPADRSARSLAHAIFVQRDDDGWAACLFLDPPGDDANDAGVPALPGDHRYGAIVLGRQQCLGLLLHRRLDRAPFFIILVQLFGDPRGFGRILRGQQAHPQIGLPDTSARIDSRSQRKTQVMA